MEERKFCQCRGMPMDKPEDAGTETGGTLSGDYCRHCYQNGAFTAPGATMDDITNLPADRFPPSLLRELYHKRWGIETSFRDLKYTLALTHFHAKKRPFIKPMSLS